MAHPDCVVSCAFSCDNRLLASTAQARVISLWNTGDHKMARQLVLQSGSAYVACSPVDHTLVAGDRFGGLTVWDTETGAMVHTLPSCSSAVTAVAINHNDSLLAASSYDGCIHLFDARCAWQPLWSVQAHEPHWENRLQFAPPSGGALLASTSFDGVGKVWDLSDASQPRLRYRFSGNAGAVLAVAFSPDGSLLAASGGDSMVRLRRARDGELIECIRGHGDRVNETAFHPRDASVLATACEDKTVRLWQL
jgi:WD40 repeat protein